MSITSNDKRTAPTSFSTGAPVQEQHDAADTVLVQPKTSYLEGSEMKHARSEPYSAPRHHAMQLVGHGIAEILEPKPKPAEPVDPVDPDESDDEDEAETEVERPDDTSRAPDQDQTTASTVPALPGAEPQRPAPGPVPPAATTEPPQPARRRGRPAKNRG